MRTHVHNIMFCVNQESRYIHCMIKLILTTKKEHKTILKQNNIHVLLWKKPTTRLAFFMKPNFALSRKLSTLMNMTWYDEITNSAHHITLQ